MKQIHTGNGLEFCLCVCVQLYDTKVACLPNSAVWTCGYNDIRSKAGWVDRSRAEMSSSRRCVDHFHSVRQGQVLGADLKNILLVTTVAAQLWDYFSRQPCHITHGSKSEERTAGCKVCNMNINLRTTELVLNFNAWFMKNIILTEKVKKK